MNSMKWSPSWGAGSQLNIQETSHFSLSPNIHYRFHKSPKIWIIMQIAHVLEHVYVFSAR